MFVIGLTGGIGTGKTLVSGLLRSLGAKVIDADLLGHEAYKRDTGAWREVVEALVRRSWALAETSTARSSGRLCSTTRRPSGSLTP